jgi:LacI family transcriptional regulator
MKTTLKDIARETGLSLSTVNHVMKGRGVFRQETKQLVLDSARKLGYRPNVFAQGVRSGRFNSVALLLSERSDSFYLPKLLLESLHDTLATKHMSMMVTRLPDQMLSDQTAVPRVLQQCMVDGMLIDYIASFPAGMVNLIHRYKMPVVWINSRQKVNAVHPDDQAAGSQAARHLLELGHRRIAFASPASAHYSLADRRRSAAATIHQAGGVVQLWPAPDPSAAALAAVYAARLREGTPPTAVIAYDLCLATAIHAAALSQGLRIPQDLSLLTFHDVPDISIGITTYLIPAESMGREAVEMILRRIAEPGADLSSAVLPFGFHAGQTCGPPPPAAAARLKPERRRRPNRAGV